MWPINQGAGGELKECLDEQVGMYRRHDIGGEKDFSLNNKHKDESYRFLSMLILTSTMMLAEAIVGFLTGSLTLLSDSLHMFSDLAALIVGFLAHRYSLRLNNTGNNNQNKDCDPYNTIGYLRMEIVGALINSVSLLTLCFTMAMEAIHRIALEAENVENVDLVLVVGGLGLVINILGLIIFGHDHGGHGHGHGHAHSHGHSHDDKHKHKDKHSQNGNNNNNNKPKIAEHGTISISSLAGNAVDVYSKHAKSVKLVKKEKVGNESVSVMSDEDNNNKKISLCQTNDDDDDDNDRDNDNANNINEQVLAVDENINIRGVFIHVLADALGSVAVMISGIIIKFCDKWWTKYVDPITTLFMVLLISRATYPIVLNTITILLDKSPNSIDINAIEKRLHKMNGVLNVHDLRVWQAAQGYLIANVHLVIDPMIEEIKNNGMTSLDTSKQVLHEFGIHNSVVQREYVMNNNSKWNKSKNPCFDLICQDKQCISQSTKLTQSNSKWKKRKENENENIISFINDCNNNNNNNINNNEEEKGQEKESDKTQQNDSTKEVECENKDNDIPITPITPITPTDGDDEEMYKKENLKIESISIITVDLHGNGDKKDDCLRASPSSIDVVVAQ